MSRRITIVLTALTTTLVLGVVGGIVLWFDDAPMPSIAPMASAESTSTAAGDWEDPWADFEARCRPLLDVAYGPTPEDLERMREDNEAMMAALDEAGVAYELRVEEDGWEYLEPVDGAWDDFDTVLSDFWEAQESEAANEEEWLAEQREQNKRLMAILDEAGIEYEVIDEGDGYQHVDPKSDAGYQLMNEFHETQWRDDVRERAEAAGADVEAVLACFDEEQELMGADMGFSPLPFHMDMRMASEQKALVEQLMAAFDEAGIAYERLDVPYIQWDHDDERAREVLEQVAEDAGYGWDMAEEDMVMMEEGLVVEEMSSDDAG